MRFASTWAFRRRHIPVIRGRPAREKGEEADSKGKISTALRVHHYPRAGLPRPTCVRTALYFSRAVNVTRSSR